MEIILLKYRITIIDNDFGGTNFHNLKFENASGVLDSRMGQRIIKKCMEQYKKCLQKSICL